MDSELYSLNLITTIWTGSGLNFQSEFLASLLLAYNIHLCFNLLISVHLAQRKTIESFWSLALKNRQL